MQRDRIPQKGLAEGSDKVAEVPTAELALSEGAKAQDLHFFGQNALCKHMREDLLDALRRTGDRPLLFKGLWSRLCALRGVLATTVLGKDRARRAGSGNCS